MLASSSSVDEYRPREEEAKAIIRATRRDLVPLSRSWNIGPSFKISSTSESKEPKKKRAPSKYNIFMSEEIKKIKAENPNMIHQEAFKTAARNWKVVK